MNPLQRVCLEDLQGGLVELLAGEVGADEEVVMLLRGFPGEALAVTTEAAILLRAGTVASGAFRTRRVQRVAIEDMLSVEVGSGLLVGRLMIREFAMRTPERRHGLYFPRKARDRFRLAAHLIRRLQEERPGVGTVREVAASAGLGMPALEPLALLSHLGEPVRRGIVTPEEFQEKKRRLLERL